MTSLHSSSWLKRCVPALSPSYTLFLRQISPSSSRVWKQSMTMASSSPTPSPPAHLSLLSKSLPPRQPSQLLFNVSKTWPRPHRAARPRFTCLAGQTGFFTRLGRLIKEKAKSDVEKIFSGGFSKTRDNLAVVDELLLYWNLADTDRVLDELEEVQSLLYLFHQNGATLEISDSV